MKTTLATCFRMVLISSTCLTATYGADDSTEIEKLENKVREDIFKETTVKATLLTNKTLGQCFAAELYHTKLAVPSHQSMMVTELVYAKTPDGLVEIDLPQSTAPLPALLKVVNPSFTIKTEQDAKLLLGVLPEIFPELDVEVKPRVIRREKAWLLITGDFFEHYSGFEIRTDDTGKITAIIRNLEMIEISLADKPGAVK